MLIPAREKLCFPVVLSLAAVQSGGAACKEKKKKCNRPSWLSKGQMRPQTVAAVTDVLAGSSCFLSEDEGNVKNLRINRLAVNSQYSDILFICKSA